jgi:hypothetical protein
MYCAHTHFFSLNIQQVRRAERLKGLGDAIAALWDRLKVPDAEREAFSASVDGR